MSKLFILLLVGGAIVLVMSGVVQVQVDAQRLPEAPEAVTQTLENRSLVERPRSYVVRGKRIVEMFFVDNESEQMDVTLDHVEADAERLLELMEKAEKATSLVPQTELLISSLEKAKKQSREISPEILASVKDRSETVFTTAYSAFVTLDQKTPALEGDTERLAAAVDSLQLEVSGLVEVEPAVAGTQDEKTGDEEGSQSENQSAPQETIPLQF